MPDITLENVHAMLERLTEYVMTELHSEIAQKADKADLDRLERKVNLILEGIMHSPAGAEGTREEKMR